MRFLLAGAGCLIAWTFVFAQTDKEVFELKSKVNFADKKEKILQMTELPDNHTLIFLGKKEMQVRDIFKSEPLRAFDHRIPNINFAIDLKPPLGTIAPISIAPDGSRGIVIAKSGSAAVWDLETGQQLGELKREPGNVRRAGFSENGKSIFLMHGNLNDMEVSFWDVKSLELQSFVKIRDLRWFYLSRDGRRLFTGAGNVLKAGGLVETIRGSNRIDIWDTRTGKIEKSLTAPDTIKYEDPMIAAFGTDAPGDSDPIVSKNERFLAARSDNRVVVWEIGENPGPKYDIAPTGGMKRVGFEGLSDDGKYLLTDRNDKAEIYETETGKLYKSFPLGNWDVYQVSPDNKLIFVLAPEAVTVHDMENERVLYKVKLKDFYHSMYIPIRLGTSGRAYRSANALFSPDGKFFMIYEEGSVKILDAATGTRLQSLYDPEQVKYGKNGKITETGLDSSEAGWLGKGKGAFVFNKDRNTLFMWSLK